MQWRMVRRLGSSSRLSPLTEKSSFTNFSPMLHTIWIKLDDLFIRIVTHKPSKTLSIIDSGIGMTEADLVNNLGSSGTKVKEALQAGADIAQLGVGFCSACLVASMAIITTEHNDHYQYMWQSCHDRYGASFIVARDYNNELLKRGTKIILFLKDDQLEYLEETRIKGLVKKYSEFISYPIYLWTEKTTVKEIGDDEHDFPKKDGDVENVDEDKEKDSKKNIQEVSHEWQFINIWLDKPEETTKEECVPLCSHDPSLVVGLQLQTEMEKKPVDVTSEKLRNHLPDHLVLFILSKLPLKSLKRFGCVCMQVVGSLI